MGKVMEFRTYYGEQQAKILNELFALPAKAAQVDVSMSNATREALGTKDFNAVQAAEGAAFAASEREKMKTEYERLDLEMRAAVEEAVNQAEQALSPKSTTADEILRASTMTEDELISAIDIALAHGDAGEDTALLCFQVARQKDFEAAVGHAIDVREDWAEIYVDIVEGANQPDLDPGDRFETLAPKTPSKQDILRAPQSDINIYGSLR
jgi:hypothetical protein